MAHVVQHGEVVDFDQAVLIAVDGGGRKEGDAPAVLIAGAVRGGHLEDEGGLPLRRGETRVAAGGAAQGDVRALKLPPAPRTDRKVSGRAAAEADREAERHVRKRGGGDDEPRLPGHQRAAGRGELSAVEDGAGAVVVGVLQHGELAGRAEIPGALAAVGGRVPGRSGQGQGQISRNGNFCRRRAEQISRAARDRTEAVAGREQTAVLHAHQSSAEAAPGYALDRAGGVAGRDRTATLEADETADAVRGSAAGDRTGGVAGRDRTAILGADETAAAVRGSAAGDDRTGGVAGRDRAVDPRAHQAAGVDVGAAAGGDRAGGVAGHDRTALLIADETADVVQGFAADGDRPGGVAGDDRTAGLLAREAADGGIAGKGVRQIGDQAEIADDRRAAEAAEEPDEALIAADAEMADGVAVAVEDGGEGIVPAADRLPAAGAVFIDDEVGGAAVARIQQVALIAVAGPTAAVAVGVEVEIPGQLIADAARAGGTAHTIANRVGAGLVAGARQVVAHVVQHGQVVDFDQAVLIAVDDGGRKEGDAPAVLIAGAVRGGHLEDQGGLPGRRGETHIVAGGAAQGDVRALKLPPAPGDDRNATGRAGAEDDRGALFHVQKPGGGDD